MGALTLAAPAAAAPRCWPDGALAAQAGEERPRRGGPGAHVSLPKRDLAAFPPVPAGLSGNAIRRVELPKGLKLVALTLDLCEQPGEVAGYDGPIVDYLRREGIKATFFAGGKWMLSHAERSRQLMADPLFEIGNHAWAHRNLRGLTGAALADEVRGPQLAYEAVRATLDKAQCLPGGAVDASRVPARIGLFRFPYGACNPTSLEAVADNGLLAIQWDVSTGDAAPTQSAQAIAGEIVRRTRPGSIILVHANGRGFNTAAALPIALPKLKAQGYTFVTVSELLSAGKPVLSATCYDSRPGDTDRYDAVFFRAGAQAKAGEPARPVTSGWATQPRASEAPRSP